MHNKGKAQGTIISTKNQLEHIARHANLNIPAEVENFIANKQGSSGYKELLCLAYLKYCQYYKIQWEMPSYQREEKMPKLPTEQQLQKLIAAAGKILALKLWLSKETGIRPIELHNLAVKDLDTEHNTINPTTSKHGAARILKIPEPLTKALQSYILKNDLNPKDKIFKSDARKYGNNFREMRNRLAKRTSDPNLATVRLYDFRHYFATKKYHDYRDVGLTAQDMGHKDWNTTQKYIHLLRIIELNQNDEEYIVKTASSVKEATDLIEHGFQYITEMEGLKIFKKRK